MTAPPTTTVLTYTGSNKLLSRFDPTRYGQRSFLVSFVSQSPIAIGSSLRLNAVPARPAHVEILSISKINRLLSTNNVPTPSSSCPFLQMQPLFVPLPYRSIVVTVFPCLNLNWKPFDFEHRANRLVCPETLHVPGLLVGAWI